MANIRQFSDNMPDVGIPSPPVQQFATDNSGAIRESAKGVRRQGQEHLAQSLVQAGAQTIQGVGAVQDRIAQEEIVSGESSGLLDSLFSRNDEIPAEERNTFRRIAELRQDGQLTADQARAASRSLLRQSVSNNPRRAKAYQAAYNEFFSDTGAGAGTFVPTEQEKLQEYMLKQGWQEFDIDPRIYHQNPVEWERQFQNNMRLQQTNNMNEQLLQDRENIQALTALEQRSVLPGVINNVLTNPQSESYLPNVVDRVMMAHRSDDGRYDASRSIQATRDLESMKIATRTQLREQFGAMKNEDFNNYYRPIEEFFDNAIAFANGEMSEEALVRENRIFKEGAVQGLYNVNPEAARAFVGLTELIKDLDPGAISPFVLQRQEELSRIIMGGMESILDPMSSMSPFDNARSPAQVEVVGESVGALSNAASNGIRQGRDSLDGPSLRRVNESVVYSAKAILSNPEDVSAQDYAKFFDAIGNANANEVLTEETRAFLTENFGSISSTYMKDTLDAWLDNRKDGTRVVFDPDTNRITAVPEDASNFRHRNNAQRMNRDMAGSNAVFRAMENALGKSGTEFLAESEVGRGVLAMSGIEVDSIEGHEMQFRELPDSLNRVRVEIVADKIIDGMANTRDLRDMQRWIDSHDIDTYNIPKLQRALEIFSGEAEPEDRAEAAVARFENWLQGEPATLEEGPQGEPLEDVAPVELEIEEDRMATLLENLAEAEGGYQNNPRDTGNFVGENNLGTNRGITPATLANWRGVDPTTITEQDMRNLTAEEANEIYISEYYEGPRINEINEDVQELVFNMAVLSGPRRAVRILQEAAGETTDGVIGQQTIAASENVTRREIADLYLEFLRGLANYDEFGAGWEARIERIVARGAD